MIEAPHDTPESTNRDFASYLKVVRTMKELSEGVVANYISDLDHDFAAIMVNPDMMFLWGPYDSGTHIVRLRRGGYKTADAYLSLVEREKPEFQWYLLDPAGGSLERVSRKEARQIATDYTTR